VYNLSFALQQVHQAFPGVFHIPMPQAARFVGISPKTARNRQHLGKPLFKTIVRDGLRYVPATELAAFVAADLDAAGFIAEPQERAQSADLPAGNTGAPAGHQKRGPGRPRKLAAGEVR
jgi:hypothetical protein